MGVRFALMVALDAHLNDVQQAVESVAATMARVWHMPDFSLVSLPFSYPDGSSVTVKVVGLRALFRVSDNGFAFREAETRGYTLETFSDVVSDIIEGSDLQKTARTIFADCGYQELSGTISEVAVASWKAAERTRIPLVGTEDETPVDDADVYLTERLINLFGRPVVAVRPKLVGASTSPWRVTAIVNRNGKQVAFQHVASSNYSVFRTSSAFSDLADLDSPPALVAVVQSKELLGSKIGLLSRSGSVVERDQSDDVFERSAA